MRSSMIRCLSVRQGLAALACAVLVGVACQPRSSDSDAGESAKAQDEVSAFVSILPQAYFVERIGGDHVMVRVLVGPGDSPATYEPTPKQMAQLAESDVYFAIGVPFETPVLPQLRDGFKDLVIVETQNGIGLVRRAMDVHHRGELEPGATALPPDPHIWLSPRHAKTIAENVKNALTRIDPVHAAEYDSNFTRLAADLDEVDAEIAEQLRPLHGQEMYVFHPAYGHFAEAYGMTQVAIEVEGESPSAKQLADLIERAQERNVRAIFVQPQFSWRTAETVAEGIGAETVILDPLAKDYLRNLREMTERIRDAFEHDAEEGL